MRFTIYLIAIILTFLSCTKNHDHNSSPRINTRHIEDTIGFAQYSWQLDSIIARMDDSDKLSTDRSYKAVICPHDDYGYAGGLYYKTLAGIKAKTIVLIGVAHSARNFDLQDRIIFGSYDYWQAPGGAIKVSPLRDELLNRLKPETFIVHDSMMQLEHSLEAITPFLQKRNPAIEILPMLVPYNTFQNMQTFSDDIGNALSNLMKKRDHEFGKDIALVISNDAIHYGSEGWGSGNLAPFGTDRSGTAQARQKDLDIINSTLEGELNTEKIARFNDITIMDNDYKAYEWTWCGRYSTPFGLLLANKINALSSYDSQSKRPDSESLRRKNLQGTFIDWRSSIHNSHINVNDLEMGHTAKADSTHWVAYVGMAYE